MNNTFAKLENFGHSLISTSFLVRPKNADEIYETFLQAKKLGLTVAPRGNGRSYNDAAMNGGGMVLDTSGMDQILSWNPATGLIRCEPGVTIQQLWKKVLPDGWWPPVVSGTMTTTLGGCLAANIHGKNNFKAGPIGEHVVEFTAILPTGAEVKCSPKKNGDLFHAMIGGLGMLGVFTSITLQMKHIYSGLIEVKAWPTPTLEKHLGDIETFAPQFDYIVGWLDPIQGQRSQIHAANQIQKGKDPDAGKNMRLEYQDLPDRFFGVMPKSFLHYFMTPFVNNLGWGAVNFAKYISALRRHTFRQPHAAFHFLLDYVPSWERSFGKGGLIQYQSFLPKETAHPTWTKMLTLSKKHSLPPYLGVTKRHRPDNFLLSYSVDGFSLALDFKVTEKNRANLNAMLQEFDAMVVSAGGRFYFAKNSDTLAETAHRFYGKETLAKFKKLKKRCDPNGLLESDLYRRIFGKL